MRVAIVPAVVGGTTVVARHLAEGFREAGHTVLWVELQSFQPRMAALSRTSTPAMILAFYDDINRHIQRQLTTFAPQALVALAQAPLRKPLLDWARACGVRSALWFVEDCVRFDYWRRQVEWYDHTFLIQQKHIDAVVQAGAPRASYLPLACLPRLHRPGAPDAIRAPEWTAPVAFMGAPYPNRIALFNALSSFPIGLWGAGWNGVQGPCRSLVKRGDRLIRDDEEATIYRNAQIVLNPHSSPNPSGDDVSDFINPRTFAVAGCRTLQIVDQRDHLAGVFSPGAEVLTYANVDELRSLLHYYLQHPEAGMAIAERAWRRAWADHTYRHRADTLLGLLMGQGGDVYTRA